jgi:two-component system response regulator HydG
MNVRNWVKTKKNILIYGETGSGKSSYVKKIANELEKTFLQINVCNLPSELIESELFGHCKGSFTGAFKDKVGLCDEVGEGVLFIDEVGELGLNLQSKLLQLLEEREFRPIGSNKVKIFRGVIVLATNRDLKQLVEQGKFRTDLYFRIITFSKKLCSLNEIDKKSQIIAQHVEKYLEHKELSFELDKFIKNYSWPGNYRELNNVLDYLSHVAHDQLTLDHLPNYLKEKKTEEPINVTTYSKALEIFEIKLLKKVLAECNYHITKCARNA